MERRSAYSISVSTPTVSLLSGNGDSESAEFIIANEELRRFPPILAVFRAFWVEPRGGTESAIRIQPSSWADGERTGERFELTCFAEFTVI